MSMQIGLMPAKLSTSKPKHSQVAVQALVASSLKLAEYHQRLELQHQSLQHTKKINTKMTSWSMMKLAWKMTTLIELQLQTMTMRATMYDRQ